MAGLDHVFPTAKLTALLNNNVAKSYLSRKEPAHPIRRILRAIPVSEASCATTIAGLPDESEWDSPKSPPWIMLNTNDLQRNGFFAQGADTNDLCRNKLFAQGGLATLAHC